MTSAVESRRNRCAFCGIVSGAVKAVEVWRDDDVVAFLDWRPLLPGHCLVVPASHYVSVVDVPTQLLTSLMRLAQRISRSFEVALDAEGSFIAINNRVSQSVPHVHVHVVPRRRGDGLRGFFWPRTRYESSGQMLDYRDRIRSGLGSQPDGRLA